MIKAKQVMVRFVRRDVPICPHHGPEYRETMRQYSQNGSVRYYKCRLEGCKFRTKTVVVVVQEQVKD